MNFFIKEPIKLQVFTLVLLFIIAFVIISSINSYVSFSDLKYEKAIINNKNESALGQILSLKLLVIENNLIKIINADSNKDIDSYSKIISNSIKNIELILSVLQKGGVYKETIPVNIVSKDEIKEEIAYTKIKYGFVIEVIELSPKIIEINKSTELLIEIIREKLNSKNEINDKNKPTSLNLLIKHIDTHFQRSHEAINQIFYKTNNRIYKLKNEKEESNRILTKIEYIIYLLTFLFLGIITHFIIKKIGVLINERKEYLTQIEKNNETIETIFNAVPVGVLLIDKKNKIQQINSTALKLFGTKNKEDILLTSCFSCFATEQENTCPLKDNNPITDLEIDLIKKNGEKITVMKNVIPITVNKEEFLLEAFMDISNIKEYEERLEIEKDKADESNRLKSAFLANMSHEIRTPMNGIIGFAQFLSNPDITKEKLEQYSKIIIKSGNHLLALINDIIDISKIESGKLSINKSKININVLINELKTFFQSYIEKINKTAINLEISTPLPNEKASVKTDPVRLKQILTNLINNAIKFTEKGSVKIGYEINDKTLLFYVKDTGIGVKKDRQKMIFKRFSQASGTTEKLYGGTGLGLSISKACVEKLGGKIWLNSEFGKGSEFFFSLPYKAVILKNNLEIINIKTTNDFKQAKVLVVEDDIINFTLLSELLNENNINVIHNENAEDAIKTIKANNDIKLVLLDIQLSGKDGNFAAREIRKLKPKLPIIAQSAYAFNKEKEISIDAGCNDYLTKPINFKELREILTKYIHL